MIYFPYINMPDHFTFLLQSNMQSSGIVFTKLHEYIYSRPGFLALLVDSFEEPGKAFDLGKVIKSHGWHGLRDRLACLFLERRLNGHFSHSKATDNCFGIIPFEDRLKSFSVGGHSRAFLLGFYLQLSNIDQNNVSLLNDTALFNFEEGLIRLMNASTSRVIKIDWILLSLKHFSHYLSPKILKNRLEEGETFESLFSSLELIQRNEMMTNFLSYGSSINDKDIFESVRI